MNKTSDADIESDAKYLDAIAVRNDDPEIDLVAARLRNILNERQNADKMSVTDDDVRFALKAYDNQSMQANDARYVCMRAALQTIAKRWNIGKVSVPDALRKLAVMNRLEPGDDVNDFTDYERGLWEGQNEVKSELASLLAASPTPPALTCETCNGIGMIGGFVNAENGYDSVDCPD